jgi:hypothetical protein
MRRDGFANGFGEGDEPVEPRNVYEGTVKRVTGSDVYVEAPGYMPGRLHGPALVVAPAGALSEGDAVLVAFSDGGEAVVLAPGTGSAAGALIGHHARHEPGGSDPMAVDAAAGVGSLRTLGTGSAQAAPGNDSRLSDARAPTGHHVSHEPGGSDAMAVDAAAATGSLRTLGTGAQQAAAGSDARLSDVRTPSNGSVTPAKLAGSPSVTSGRGVLWNGSAWVDPGAAFILEGDARLTNARTPSAHHATHEPGGSDAMAVDAAAATGSLRTVGKSALQAADGAATEYAFSAYKLVAERYGQVAAASNTTLKILGSDSAALNTGTSGGAAAARKAFPLVSSLYGAGSRSLKLLLVVQCFTNDVGPGTTLTVALTAVSSVSGATGNLFATMSGTNVTGSSVAIASGTLTADTIVAPQLVGPFDFPADGCLRADGEATAATAASSRRWRVSVARLLRARRSEAPRAVP